jgi:hypothetical protein
VARLKIRRKDLRRPDEFMEFTGRAWQWVLDNRKATITVAVSVVVLLAAVSGFRRYKSYREFAAAEAFRKATALFAEGDTTAAAAAFEAVPRVGGYGVLADLYRGQAALKDGDASAAAGDYSLAASESETPPYLRQQATYGLAHALAEQGDSAGALAHYEEAANLPGPFKVDARLAAARLSQAAGDSSKARSLYELAVSDAEDSGPVQDDMRKLAAWHLASLGGPAPELPPTSTTPAD